jgi:hypothetical protein
MASNLGPAFSECGGRCPQHPACEGKVRERYLVDWRPELGPKPDLECDACGAWFDARFQYLRHDPVAAIRMETT